MVRDDFWMKVTRFLRELDVRLVEGHNSAAVDLFDLAHAQSVLEAFGRALGRLPDKPAQLSKEQTAFLRQATTELAEEEKVVCVRLALAADMMKGKPWTPATLKSVGGIAGVGVTFLEETFSAATAPPQHRIYQKAARAVLRELVPASRTAIKGRMRPADELLEASGYDGPRRGLRRVGPHPRHGSTAYHAYRPRGRAAGPPVAAAGSVKPKVLPVDARLPGPRRCGNGWREKTRKHGPAERGCCWRKGRENGPEPIKTAPCRPCAKVCSSRYARAASRGLKLSRKCCGELFGCTAAGSESPPRCWPYSR